MPQVTVEQALQFAREHHQAGNLSQAEAIYRQILQQNPHDADALHFLGVIAFQVGRIDIAADLIRQAVALRPTMAEAHNNLGMALKDTGDNDAVIAAFRQAVALAPNHPGFHSNLVYALHFHPACDAHTIVQELRLWNLRHGEPLKGFIRAHPNDRTPERRLRVGYVSPDFRNHCQSLFTIPLLEHHDHSAFEIFGYSSVARPDGHTRRLAKRVDVWREVRTLDDAALCDLIRGDRIDMLIDLAMHMARGRPLVFARKPAPLQVAWLAYPGTTGIGAMDYRFTDPHLDPPGAAVDEVYTEKSIRLPATFWCYDPLEDAAPSVGPLPALANGHVTFGCLNNFCKINDEVLKVWARVMAGVAGSRLVMLANAGRHRERTLMMLERLGVSRERVRFEPQRTRPEYLRLYQQIDIGLDTVPYNGHTTSLDSVFMGVPVVTLVGRTVVGRAGLSQLMNLDMPELIGRTEDEFVDIAKDLASDLGRLAGIRSALRARMQSSPLMDGAAFARGIEAAYRLIWRQWCATPSASAHQ